MIRPHTTKLNFGKALLLLAGAWIAAGSPVARGQGGTAPAVAAAQTQDADAKPAAFDVITIKPNKADTRMSDTGMMSSRVRVMTPPDGYSASNVTVRSLISSAYGVKEDLISGPDWVGSTGYDIEAKVIGSGATDSQPLGRAQRNLMMQSLLADRFKLVVHPETKEQPIYELTLAKGGAKLKEAKPGDTYPNGVKGPDGVAHAGMMMMRPGQYSGQAVTVASFLGILSQQLHRTIVDKTGLTGKYDITLQWTPDPGTVPVDAPAADSSGPSLFTALQEQLGLKLESTKGPVKTLVIDHVELPTEN